LPLKRLIADQDRETAETGRSEAKGHAFGFRLHRRANALLHFRRVLPTNVAESWTGLWLRPSERTAGSGVGVDRWNRGVE
jgi:hypothetical protein